MMERRKRYYRLNEVAKASGCSIDDLIHYACYGELEICAKVWASDVLWEWPPKLVYERINQLENAGIGRYFLGDPKNIKDSDGSWKIYYDKEALDCSFDTGFGQLSLNIIQEWNGRIVLTASTLFAIAKEKFYEIEKLGDKENASIEALLFTLPKGYELRDGLGVGFDGKSQSSFFRANSVIEIPFSELLVTEKEQELFLSGGKRVSEEKNQKSEETQIPASWYDSLSVISAILSKLKVDPEKDGIAVYIENLTHDNGASVSADRIRKRLEQIVLISEGKLTPENGLSNRRQSDVTRVNNTLLRIISALLTEAKIDPKSQSASSFIKELIRENDIPVAEKTIRRILREIVDTLENRMK